MYRELSYSGVQIAPWGDTEEKVHHMYFPANFLKFDDSNPTRWKTANSYASVSEALTSTACNYLNNINGKLLLYAITYDAHHCK